MTRQIEDTLKLKVTDFGPIVNAEIDLRPLTVFIGPSNTGKSYLAILIYALHRVFSRTMGYPRRRYLPIGYSAIQKLSASKVNALVESARPAVTALEENGSRSLVLPAPVAELVRSIFDGMTGDLSDEIVRCFGIGELHKLIRHGRADTSRIVIQQKSCDGSDFLRHVLSFAQHAEFTSTVPAESKILLDSGDLARTSIEHLSSIYNFLNKTKSDADDRKADDRKFVATEIMSSFCEMILTPLFGPLPSAAYYLPADRTGVMHAHSVVVSALIASAPAGGPRPAESVSTLSGVLADFLGELINIDRKKRGVKESGIAEKIEELILEGSVSINHSPHVNYPRFSYRPNGWKDDLALANASSMVSELAPVVLYLRHMIKPGNVLIVEEPESHLHPAMQVQLTYQLAALIQAGVRVIVTTHSEWFLEGLSNIVHRSKILKSKRNDVIALHEDQVGAWLFRPQRSPKGSVVSEVRPDESGLYSSGYNAVSEVLHNDWAAISSQIEDES